MNKKIFFILVLLVMTTTLFAQKAALSAIIYETSASGDKLKKILPKKNAGNATTITLQPEKRFQTITGFGGSFTEASAYLLNKLSKANQQKILKAYFSKAGANYSLTRTHIASCDFALENYTYAPVANDTTLEHFTIERDRENLIPFIKAAKKISASGFKIIASPWTAPPWMKDNDSFIEGKLLPQYRDVFALYYTKYFEAYKKEGIPIWAITVMNEPNGNGNNWESTLFSPKEMTDFVAFHLGPVLEKNGWGKIKILGYDQNRAGLKEWVDEMYRDKTATKYFGGTAIHWYESTYDYFPAALDYAHHKMPTKHLIQTEACIDAEVPHWKDDSWYWSKEATDWGWDWAPENEKYLHPKYAPVNRYATDIIGCLNHGVDGWVDWNMLLNKQGGPNWFKNWCTASVIVDEEKDEVYFTPLYYIMSHFSKFIRPAAVRIGFENSDKELMVTTAQNPDGSIAVVVFNGSETKKLFNIVLQKQIVNASINAKAIQTILIK